MKPQSLAVLAINSMPANGNAGLKMVNSILGSQVIPIPSVILSGLGNMHHMDGFVKYPFAMKELLEGSLKIAQQRSTRVILYVGYLGSHEQIIYISEVLEKYQDQIAFVFVDPVCGDHGKAYVDPKIIAHWPLLLEKADLAIPNLTEVAILGGNSTDFSTAQTEQYLEDFQQKYPRLNFVATSLSSGEELINRLYFQEKVTNFQHFLYPGNYSGAGDTFASLFLLFHFFKGYSMPQSLHKAGDVMAHLIRHSMLRKSEDLLIQPNFQGKKEDYFDL